MFILASGPMFDSSTEVMLWPSTPNSPREPGGAALEAVEKALGRDGSQGTAYLHLASIKNFWVLTEHQPAQDTGAKKLTFLAVVRLNPRK